MDGFFTLCTMAVSEKIHCYFTQRSETIGLLHICFGHNITLDVRITPQQINTTPQYILTNTAHLIQLPKSLLIQKFKQVGRMKWDQETLSVFKATLQTLYLHKTTATWPGKNYAPARSDGIGTRHGVAHS